MDLSKDKGGVYRMELSTSTNIHQFYKQDYYFFDAVKSIELCKKTGYRAIDISMHSVSIGNKPMAKDDWKDWVYSVRKTIEANNLFPTQAHAFFFSRKIAQTQEACDRGEKLIRRSIEAAGLLNAPWIVVHPIHGLDVVGLTHNEIFYKNVDYFNRLADYAEKNHIGIAVENMFEGSFESAEDLLQLINEVGRQNVGICWDTGHAHLAKQDQVASILALGKRCKALHISDNNGKYDEHMLPYFGSIDWQSIVTALKNSGYEGDFTYEIHNTTKNVPIPLRERLLRYTWEVGQELLKL